MKKEIPNPNDNRLSDVIAFTADSVQKIAGAQTVFEKSEVDGKPVITVYKLTVGFAGGSADINARKKGREQPAGAGGSVTKTPVALLFSENGKLRVSPLAPPPPKPSLISAAIPFILNKLKKKKGAKSSGE